jgi:hypothetical protein
MPSGSHFGSVGGARPTMSGTDTVPLPAREVPAASRHGDR